MKEEIRENLNAIQEALNRIPVHFALEKGIIKFNYEQIISHLQKQIDDKGNKATVKED